MLELAFVFTDSMVLQRNKEIRIWGTCDKDAKVTGTFRGVTTETVGENGTFMLVFPPCEAGKGYELSVKSGNDEIVLKDVAVGEVVPHKKRFLIKAQDGIFEILKCQAPGGKALDANVFLNGYRFKTMVVSI